MSLLPETVKKNGRHSGITVVIESEPCGVQFAGRCLHGGRGDGSEPALGEVLCQQRHCASAVRVKANCSIKSGANVIGLFNPFNADGTRLIKAKGVNGFDGQGAAYHASAKHGRAVCRQTQGWAAVILAANHYPKFFPMLMTAAGTVKAARVVILGVGVAGLQAIATAKRWRGDRSVRRAPFGHEWSNRSARSSSTCRYETDEERETAQGVGVTPNRWKAGWHGSAPKAAKRVAMADIVITTALILMPGAGAGHGRHGQGDEAVWRRSDPVMSCGRQSSVSTKDKR